MKFELEPDNRGADDEKLLSNLREVSVALGKDFVTKEEYNKHGHGFGDTSEAVWIVD